MTERTYADFIGDMIDSAERIQQKTKNITKRDLDNDDTLGLALERLFEIIGEAANRLPKELQAKYPDVPWGSIIGMRNIIIHAYDRVDTTEIWNAIQNKLPELKEKLIKVLENFED